jgi:MFS family permease
MANASVASTPQTLSPGRFSFRAVAVTLAALIAYRLGSQLPLPGLDLTHFSHIIAGGGTRPQMVHHLSILALGILPWFSAFTFVELIAILLPKRWTAQFTNDGRAQPLSRSVVLVALALAALQGYGIAEAMMHQENLVGEPEPTFILLAVATLAAGTAILIALGVIIEHLGIGDGFLILLAASMLSQTPSQAGVMLMMVTEGIASPAAAAVSIALTVAIVALLAALLEARWRANATGLGIVIWPLVLASLASGVIAAVASIVLPEGSDDIIDALAQMLTNQPAGFVIGAGIACAFVARYASREGDWRFFLPVAGLMAIVQLHSMISLYLVAPPPLAGASLVIVAAVLCAVLLSLRTLPGDAERDAAVVS